MTEPLFPPGHQASGRAVVIIPTYNEAANIQFVLDLVLTLPEEPSVIIVDDNSPDGTADRIREAQEVYGNRIALIERPGKMGLGTAYVQGFSRALDEGFAYICEMDADMSHNPLDLSRLIEPVASGDTDLAIGSRYIDGVRIINWPLSRLILSFGASVYTRAITRMPVYDVTAGFKCFHRRVLEAIELDRVRSNGYSFQLEMHYRVWRKGFRIMEVPIIFTERTEGQSKMSKAIMREAAMKVWELRIRDLLRRL